MNAKVEVKKRKLYLRAFINLPTGKHRKEFIKKSSDMFLKTIGRILHVAKKYKRVPAKHKKTVDDVLKSKSAAEAKEKLIKTDDEFVDYLKKEMEEIDKAIKAAEEKKRKELSSWIKKNHPDRNKDVDIEEFYKKLSRYQQLGGAILPLACY